MLHIYSPEKVQNTAWIYIKQTQNDNLTSDPVQYRNVYARSVCMATPSILPAAARTAVCSGEALTTALQCCRCSSCDRIHLPRGARSKYYVARARNRSVFRWLRNSVLAKTFRYISYRPRESPILAKSRRGDPLLPLDASTVVGHAARAPHHTDFCNRDTSIN